MNLDNYISSERSCINLESPNSQGDMGFSGFILKSLYDNFVFAEYVDLDNGFIKDEKSGLLKAEGFTTKSWRKAKVLMVGPYCNNTVEGDIIIFPNDKGLLSGEVDVYVTNESGERVVKKVKNGIFLDEKRIFAKVEKNSNEF